MKNWNEAEWFRMWLALARNNLQLPDHSRNNADDLPLSGLDDSREAQETEASNWAVTE